MARVWRVGAPWHARARRGEARWARPRGDRGSLSRSRLLPRGREDERAPFRDPRGGERKSDLRCPLFVDRRGGETRDGLTRDARVVNARSAYLEFVGHGVGSAARAKFWPGPRPASADARSARFSEGCRKPETKTSATVLVQIDCATKWRVSRRCRRRVPSLRRFTRRARATVRRLGSIPASAFARRSGDSLGDPLPRWPPRPPRARSPPRDRTRDLCARPRGGWKKRLC